jgi:hypothetical protein
MRTDATLLTRVQGDERRMGECPKMGQTQQLVQRVAVPINGGHSWTSASEFCAARGAALCCAADICDHESGVPFQEV